MEKTMDKIIALAKARGFVYPGSEIYGGLANTWDYGNLGVELKNNVKRAWWQKFIQESPYNVGVDCAILMNPQTWIASGHLGSFSDPLMDCKECHERFRADKLIEDFCADHDIEIEGSVDEWSQEKMMDFIKEHEVACPSCGKHNFTDIRQFNLMFKTFQGVTEDVEGPAEDRNMNTLVDMISGMEVKEDNENFMNAVDYMFKGLEKRKPDCFAVKQYKKYKLASGKTAKSILISCGSRLAPFDIPQLREIMSYDELALDRIGDRKTAVFFTISDTTPTYNFLVALAFSQMFNLLCERADNVHGGRLPHHVRVLWDEAANTGQVPNLEKLVAVIRSREISLTLFYQQMAQCKAIYDKHAETIMGNMDSVVFLGGRESSTIKEISENWLGKSTIYMQTDGRSKGQSESYNLNTQRLGRELMTPAELATMPGDRCILQLRGLPPFYSPKYDLKQHPNYKYTAEADQVKNAFSLDKLINRRRRPGLNEACEVYEADGTDTGPIGEDEDILNYDDVDDPDAYV